MHRKVRTAPIKGIRSELVRFAQNKPLELVDGERLQQWLAIYLDVTV